jgi:hypothetical protein
MQAFSPGGLGSQSPILRAPEAPALELSIFSHHLRVDRHRPPLLTNETQSRKDTVRHSPPFVLFLLSCSMGAAQITDQERASLPKSFHDDALNITYFFPSHFAPASVPADSGATTPRCAHTILAANSAIPAGPSSFVISMIDSSCPSELREAASLGPFTRVQLLRQLKQYGEPSITHAPVRYVIDGRSAAITLASVSVPAADHQAGRTIYAAKACAVDGMPTMTHKKAAPADPISRVLCFDFTTQNSDLINMMFSFVIQFDNDPPEPLFPGSVHPRY